MNARQQPLRLGEVLGRRLAVHAGEHQAADVAGQQLGIGHELPRQPVLVGGDEGLRAGPVGGGVGRPVDRFQHQVVQHERRVEDRVADVSDLEVDHPEAIGAHEDVLGREVAVHETDACGEQLLGIGADGAGQARPAAHDRPVVGIDAQLVERLDVAEAPREVVVAQRGRLPGPQELAQPPGHRRVRFAGEQELFPVAPAVRSTRDRDGAGVLVDGEHLRGRPGDDLGGESKRIGLGQRALPFGEPLLGHPQPWQRLLDDDVQTGGVNREDDVRDAPLELRGLDGGPGVDEAALLEPRADGFRRQQIQRAVTVSGGRSQAMWISTSSATPPRIV